MLGTFFQKSLKSLKPLIVSMAIGIGFFSAGTGFSFNSKAFAGDVIPFPKPNTTSSATAVSGNATDNPPHTDNVQCIGALGSEDPKTLHDRLFAAVEKLGPIGMTSREFELRMRKLKSPKVYSAIVEILEDYNNGFATIQSVEVAERSSYSMRLGMFNLYVMLPGLNAPEEENPNLLSQIEPLVKALIFTGSVVKKYTVIPKAELRFQKEDEEFFSRLLWLAQDYVFAQILSRNFPPESEIIKNKFEFVMLTPYATIRTEDAFSFDRIREIAVEVSEERDMDLLARYLDLAHKVYFFWGGLRVLEDSLVNYNRLPLGADYRSDNVLIYISSRMRQRDFLYLDQVEAVIDRHISKLVAKLTVSIQHEVYGGFMEDVTAKDLTGMFLSFQEDIKGLDVP